MSCHVCVKTGERTCDPEEAEIKCFLCGRCAAEKEREHEAGNKYTDQIMKRFTEVQ